MNPSLDLKTINTIRTLSIDAIQKADSGHPGLPLGAAPMAYVLWSKFLKHNPKNPKWWDRDRFVLSAGHGSMLQYSLLHLFGYDLSLDEIKNFRQWGSKTPGHPEFGLTPGVEATTGPLGQGASNAVGMALAERALAHLFNRPGFEIFNHTTYALVSDGDLMEGVSTEAASFAGHNRLGKLIYLYDANDITLDGPSTLAFSEEDVGKRYEAYGWHVQTVKDGDKDLQGLEKAIANAKKETSKPSLIIVKTTIGFGSPNKQGKSSVHGSPLGKDELALTKKQLGFDPEKFFDVPGAVKDHLGQLIQRGVEEEKNWNQLLTKYKQAHPDLYQQLETAMSGKLPSGWDSKLPVFKTGEDQATRASAGKALNALAQTIPWLIGGDADLSCSTSTGLKDLGDFNGQTGAGRNIHYGVREHAMGAIANGMAYHGGLRTFTATFFCFVDYMRPTLRLAAMNHLPVTYVYTHDSIGLGEDGPTHQPVEHLMSLRVMPGLVTLRPADPNESAQAWKVAMKRTQAPTALVLSRQKLPVLDRSKYKSADGVEKGAYILYEKDPSRTQSIVIATGSEVAIAAKAVDQLEGEGIHVRLVSMPSWELFAAQPKSYQDEVLSPSIRNRVSIEAGVTLGWQRWIGDQGIAMGVDRYGASAPDSVLYQEYGLTVDAVINAVKKLTKL